MNSKLYDGLTPHQIERVGHSVHNFVKAAHQDAQFKAEALEKLGFSLPPWMTGKTNPSTLTQKTLRQAYEMVPAALAGAGIAAVGGAATSAYKALSNKASLVNSYRGMLRDNPDLAEEDSSQVQRAFKALHHLNPDYAKDPYIAGTFVKNTLRNESLHMGEVNQLAQARRAMAQGPDDFFSKATRIGGTLESMRSSVERGQLSQKEHLFNRARDVRESQMHGPRMEEAQARAAKQEEDAARATIAREREEALLEELRKNLGQD